MTKMKKIFKEWVLFELEHFISLVNKNEYFFFYFYHDPSNTFYPTFPLGFLDPKSKETYKFR